MKGEISDNIMIIGIIGIVFITVSAAYVSLNQINLPEDKDQKISGGVFEVSDKLARMAESCWRQSGKGSQSRQEDCFNAKIYSNDTVTEQNISNMLERIPEEKIGLQGTIPEGESNVKVTYRPVDETINISTLSICRPSKGDTCLNTECSCQNGACGPEFDPDGDGNTETDKKGCITDYSFEPSEEPCDSLSCSDKDNFRLGTQNNDFFEFKIEDKIGLRNAVIAKYPISDNGEKNEIRSENLISPEETVGHGNTSRKLFKEEGRINISNLDENQKYGLFIWGCDNSGIPENCRWLKPYMINGEPKHQDDIWIEELNLNTGSKLDIEAEIRYDLSSSKKLSTELRNSTETVKETEKTLSGDGTFTVTGKVPKPGSQETYIAETDTEDNVQEKNEQNNKKSKTFNPLTKKLEAVSFDLKETGEDLQIQGKINFNLPQQENIDLKIYRDGTQIATKTLSRQGTGTETITETITKPANQKTFKISLDPQNKINENQEDNNNITKQYTPSNGGLKTFTVNLEPGWNIISSPIQSDIQIDSIPSCNLQKIKNGKKAITLKENVEYTNQITDKRGYLVKAYSGCTFQKQGQPSEKNNIQLYEGWNLISTNGSINDYTGCTDLGHGGNNIWNYNPISKVFEHSINQPWQGFYLKSENKCKLKK